MACLPSWPILRLLSNLHHQSCSHFGQFLLFFLQALFDYGAGAAPSKNAQALQELYVEGMDPEQIWLQLELQAEPLLKRTRRLMRKIGPNPTLLTPEMDAALAGE